MRAVIRDLRDFLISLPLAVALLALSIVLVLAATLDQVNIGVWGVQEKYFHTFAVFLPVGKLTLAVFPGGYLLGGLLAINLMGSLLWRVKWCWRKSGIIGIHIGLILLLVGELLTGLLQNEYYLRLDEGETRNYAESYRDVEVAITDVTHGEHDEVWAVPERTLVQKRATQHPQLPFRVVPLYFFPNAEIRLRNPMSMGPAATSEMSANAGLGPRLLATNLPVTNNPKERNVPATAVELIGADGSIGTWLLSPSIQEVQSFQHDGRTWTIDLRFARNYQPFALTLLKFNHDRYPGTNIPKNFSSQLHLTTPDGVDDREVLIYMNNPLRYGGLTFYQAGFENNDTTTILQVVRNPSWQLPYIACVLMTLGLGIQFSLRLATFVRGRYARTPVPTPAETGALAEGEDSDPTPIAP